MNHLKTFTFLVLSLIITLSACSENNTKESTSDAESTNQEMVTPTENTTSPQENMTPTTSPITPEAEPAQNAAGVWHYTCSKGCKGGAGEATNCTSCGNLLVHNTAYHSGVPGAINPSQNAPITTPNTMTTQEPPQNAAGVWHFTCSKGCKGGAGAATPCSTCGTTLIHNATYHQ